MSFATYGIRPLVSGNADRLVRNASETSASRIGVFQVCARPSLRSRQGDLSGASSGVIASETCAQRRGIAEHQQRADDVEARDDHVGRRHAEEREHARRPRARRRRAPSRVVVRDDAHRADQRVGRHGLGDQRAAHAEIGRAHQPHQGRDDQHDERRDRAERRRTSAASPANTA